MKIIAITITIFALMSVTISSPSQSEPSGSVYRDQFKSLRAQVADALAKLGSSGNNTKKPTKQDLFDLTKLVHRLQESSGEDSIHAKDSRQYLLIGQGCIALDFITSALTGYVETGDRSFLTLARSGDELVKSVEKTL